MTLKKLSKNRWRVFIIVYLCILSFFALGLSWSRYTTGDTQTDDANAAVYNVVISTGVPGSNEVNRDLTVYATAKISEPASMVPGTYDKLQINIINKSECDISLSNFQFNPSEYYTKLILPMTQDEFDKFEISKGSVPLALADYLNINLNDISIDTLKTAIDKKNKETIEQLEGESIVLKPEEMKSFMIFSWVEHDAVYKEDADLNAEGDHISYKTLAYLGITSEPINFSLHSEQVD